MITAAHLRAARALLGLTIDDIASAAGLSSEIVEQAEAGQEHDFDILRLLRNALEEKGIAFLADNSGMEGGIGVRLRNTAQASQVGIRPENLNAANDG